MSTSKESFVVGMQALPGNPYDGHMLKALLAQTQRLTGMMPGEAYVDRGYRGHGVPLDGLKVRIPVPNGHHRSHQEEAQAL